MWCHAGAGHAAATDHGVFGWLCDDDLAAMTTIRFMVHGLIARDVQ